MPSYFRSIPFPGPTEKKKLCQKGRREVINVAVNNLKNKEVVWIICWREESENEKEKVDAINSKIELI